jgi:hypothetical protein
MQGCCRDKLLAIELGQAIALVKHFFDREPNWQCELGPRLLSEFDAKAIDKRPARLFVQNVREARDTERQKLEAYNNVSREHALAAEWYSDQDSNSCLSRSGQSAPESIH